MWVKVIAGAVTITSVNHNALRRSYRQVSMAGEVQELYFAIDAHVLVKVKYGSVIELNWCAYDVDFDQKGIHMTPLNFSSALVQPLVRRYRELWPFCVRIEVNQGQCKT